MHATTQIFARRSLWKGPFFVPLPKGDSIKTMARSSTILPSHVGRKFQVHNGNKYIPVLVTELMVNKKLGEFAPTRKPFSYKKKEFPSFISNKIDISHFLASFEEMHRIQSYRNHANSNHNTNDIPSLESIPGVCFWDIENCPLPSHLTIPIMMKQIRDFAFTKRIALAQIIAVGNHSYLSKTCVHELESLGISLQNHTNNKPNATDIFMINTIHSYCHNHRVFRFNKPPHAIIVIASDGGLCKMLTWLESVHYNVILIHPNVVAEVLSTCVRDTINFNIFLSVDFINTFKPVLKNTAVEKDVVLNNNHAMEEYVDRKTKPNFQRYGIRKNERKRVVQRMREATVSKGKQAEQLAAHLNQYRFKSITENLVRHGFDQLSDIVPKRQGSNKREKYENFKGPKIIEIVDLTLDNDESLSQTPSRKQSNTSNSKDSIVPVQSELKLNLPTQIVCPKSIAPGGHNGLHELKIFTKTMFDYLMAPRVNLASSTRVPEITKKFLLFNAFNLGNQKISFNWNDSATSVQVCGNWNWETVTNLQKTESGFTASLFLPKGLYLYHYIIDGNPKYVNNEMEHIVGVFDSFANYVLVDQGNDRRYEDFEKIVVGLITEKPSQEKVASNLNQFKNVDCNGSITRISSTRDANICDNNGTTEASKSQTAGQSSLHNILLPMLAPINKEITFEWPSESSVVKVEVLGSWDSFKMPVTLKRTKYGFMARKSFETGIWYYLYRIDGCIQVNFRFANKRMNDGNVCNFFKIT